MKTRNILIDLENKNLRTPAYKSDLAYIDRDSALDFLNKTAKNPDLIPEKGEKVRVIGTCNIGSGGTAEDVTDKLSPELVKLSEKIASELVLPVVGIDFYNDQIIELNATPSLYYPIPTENANRSVDKLLDYLETI